LGADKLVLESSNKRKYLDKSTPESISKIKKVSVNQNFNDVLNINAELAESELPKLKINSLTLPNDYKTLLPREWISSFIIDDVISYLIINYGKDGSTLYISSGIYQYFYTMQDNTNIVQKFINTDTLNKGLILITINTNLRGEHWILGIIH